VKTSIRLHAQHGTLQCTMPNGACFSELDTRKEVCFALGYQRSLRSSPYTCCILSFRPVSRLCGGWHRHETVPERMSDCV
jgi:hypothetical protein